MTRGLMILICLAAVPAMSTPTFASNGQADKSNTFEVPTTGRIIDVTYMPEFDEWWVKCQEKNGISVYTYDRRSKKWHRAQFLPAPPKSGEKAKGAEPTSSNEVKPKTSKTTDGSEETAKKPPGAESAPAKAGAKGTGEAAKEKKQHGAAKKWWDPRNILKLDLSKTPQK